MYKQPYLQPYKGRATRHTCPECGIKDCFTLYLDGNTHEPINSKVGKCNREIKCGYHYTPKQYFLDNPTKCKDVIHYISNKSKPYINAFTPKPPLRGGLVGLPFSYVEKSASYKSNFIRFLCSLLTEEQIHKIGEDYAIGATKNKEVIFWQIDINGKVRTGKIMQYNPETGKRIKHESGAIDWVHNKLKHSKLLPDDFYLQQCFFGEHLLKIYPNHTIAIVESEKTALIASAVFPDLVWLASGGVQGLTVEKCKVLANRNIILYPDLNAFNKWANTAKLLNSLSPSPNGEGLRVRCSNLLENISTPEAKQNGLDLSDFLILQLKHQKNKFSPQHINNINHYSSILQSFIITNNFIEILINKLELEEL